MKKRNSTQNPLPDGTYFKPQFTRGSFQRMEARTHWPSVEIQDKQVSLLDKQRQAGHMSPALSQRQLEELKNWQHIPDLGTAGATEWDGNKNSSWKKKLQVSS